MSFINDIINDTLKVKDDSGTLRWSRTSLTMFSCMSVVLFAFIVDTVKHGGEVDDTKFGLLLTAGLGVKLANSWGKKIEQPDSTNPSNDTNINVDVTK